MITDTRGASADQLVSAAVESLKESGNAEDIHDLGFFRDHINRFAFLLKKLDGLETKNKTVMDLGSYHLHLAMLLRSVGFSVVGVDIPVFANKEIVRERAVKLGITNRPYGLNEMGKPSAIPYPDSSVDLVICTEMLEHITFNPVRFWSEVYRVMRDGALLYLTTPNSLSFFNLLAQLKRLVTLESVGIEVDAILGSITSGHHWKEFSLAEITHYFKSISSDFDLIDHEFYKYRDFSRSTRLYRSIYWLQEEVLPRKFRSELLAVFQVKKSRGIEIEDPDAHITLRSSHGSLLLNTNG